LFGSLKLPKLKIPIGIVSERALNAPSPTGLVYVHHKKEESDIMLLLTDSQQCVLGPVVPKSKGGNPAPIDGKPVWTVSDPTILTLTVTDDGLSATVVSTGKLGTSQVAVSADADLGEGVTTISGTVDVTVQAGAAVTLEVPTGAPTEKP
jgi:hypothetical protein